MGILDEDIVRVREASDFIAIASQHLALKRVGSRWVGLCPFHAEKSASFTINPDPGLYYCFGCQAKGDVITFVREMEHLDFVGAVEWLAAKSGITLRYTQRAEGEGRKRRSRLVDAVQAAVDWYHERLLSGADAGEARSYLRSRGLDGETVRQYRIGWAPDDWDALSRDLDLPADVLRDSGLGFVNRRNRRQDTFRARVLFPIFDSQGDPVAFGGRSLPGVEGVPKYKNSPETPIYAKSKVLYGLNWSKQDIVTAGEAVVCEGYTDVIGLAQAGLPRGVATCGTALTEDHVRTLKRFANRLVLAFDADAAGQAAAERVYEWEHKHDLEVKVADLPSGVDPADLARRDPEALRKAVAGAAPLMEFRVERVLAAGDLSGPEGRARAAERAVAVIREHPSDLVRDQYLMQVADRCRVDAAPLRARLQSGDGASLEAPQPVRARRPDRDTPETAALALLVHRPDDVREDLREWLFADEVDAAAYRALVSTGSLTEALAVADPEVVDLLQRLAVEETEADPEDVLQRVVEEATNREIRRLEAKARDEDQAVDLTWPKQHREQMRDELNDADTRKAARVELLGWLTPAEESA